MMAWLNEDEASAKAEYEKARGEAIGPVGSSVLLGPLGVLVYFKVRWSMGLEGVLDLAERGEIDCYTEWCLHGGGPHGQACSVQIGWPDVGTNVVLFFDLAKWGVELGMVRGSNTMVLVPENAKGADLLSKGLIVPCDDEFLAPVLDAYEKLKPS